MKKILLLFVIVFSLVLPNSSFAFTQMVSFGDSLSDNGTSVWTGDDQGFGRSSNGYVWVDYLALNLGLVHDGRAYGGALTGMGNVIESEGVVLYPNDYGLLWQVDEYDPDTVSPKLDTLFTLWAGGNDLREIENPIAALPLIGMIQWPDDRPEYSLRTGTEFLMAL